MLQVLIRGLYKSVHLVHTKPIPPNPQFFTKRGLAILPRSGSQQVPSAIPFQILPLAPIVPLLATPNTRFPTQDKKTADLKIVKATRKYLRSSIKKIWPVASGVRRVHVEDAIQALENIRRKPAEWLKNIIKAGVRSAVNIKGMSEDRLYIKEIIIGKNTGIKGIRYHAKMKSGRMLRPKSQVTFIIVEKTVEELYKIMMTGKFSPAIANYLRTMMLTNNASYSEIRDIQNLLTSKGRQQQRLMTKRRVDQIIAKKKEQGLVLDFDYVMQGLLEEEAKSFAEKYWTHKRLEAEKKIAERQEIFNKNQKSS